jgi:four helix bundle protein
MDFAAAVYRVTRDWPKDELYGLTSQVRRAAVSIASNIAEGHGRSGGKEFSHHLSIAYGSLCEAETQLLLAESLGYLSGDASATLLAQAAAVRRLVLGLLRSLRQ